MMESPPLNRQMLILKVMNNLKKNGKERTPEQCAQFVDEQMAILQADAQRQGKSFTPDYSLLHQILSIKT